MAEPGEAMTRAEAERRAIESARRLLNTLECVGPTPGASDEQIREMKHAIGSLVRDLDALPADGGWRPVTEPVPSGTDRVWIAMDEDDGTKSVVVVTLHETALERAHPSITHWMPATNIPAPPDEERG